MPELQKYYQDATTALQQGGGWWKSWGSPTDSTLENMYNLALKQYEFDQNKYMANMANQHEINMWNMQNAYNTPAEQMKRFAAAGLNPMLIYSQGTPGNATSAPQTHTAQYSAPTMRENKQEVQFNQVMQTLSTIKEIGTMVSDIIGQSVNTSRGLQELQPLKLKNALLGSMADAGGFGSEMRNKYSYIFDSLYQVNKPDGSFWYTDSDGALKDLRNTLFPQTLRSQWLDTLSQSRNEAVGLQNWFNEYAKKLMQSGTSEFDHVFDDMVKGAPEPFKGLLSNSGDFLRLLFGMWQKSLFLKNR